MRPADEEPMMTPTRYGSVMSTPNINELSGKVEGGHMAKFNRSSSVGPGMTASNLNPLQLNRRALYVNLPFFRGLERRLIARLPRERGPGVPEGRSKPKPSDEEFWHAAGVYNSQEASHNRAVSTKTIAPGEAACARLSTVKVSARNLPLLVDLYKKSVAPVLQVKGFCGAQVFSDRAAGTVQSLTLWETWGDLENAVADPRYSKAMRSVQDLIEAPPVVMDTEVACSILPTTGGGDCGDIP